MKLPFDINFEGKVVAITGAAGVICSELSKAFACAKAKVAILDLDLEKASKVAEEIKKDGGIAEAFQINCLKKEEIVACHKAVNDAFGKVDILVNGAGGNNPKASTDDEFFDTTKEGLKTFFDLDPSGIEFVFNLNFLATLLVTQEFAKDMVNRKGCSILNISSMNAFTPLTKIPAYSGAKASVSNFTKWLAVYFSKIGIRVNAIAPGFFSTTQNKSLLWNKDGTPTARTHKILNNTPMDRFGEVSELVGATLFLSSEEAASFITGVVLPIDGGFSSYSGV
ncbi:MAG TPA: D-mannonate oxidoreductase [Firmicutes bacterium]|nr:D-mannonate oxidoreductase [Bacillota bacterium]